MQKVKFNVVFSLYSAFLGLFVGAAAALFLVLINQLIELVWHQIPNRLDWSFYPLIIGLLGGLLVGLLQRYIGDYPKTMHDTLHEFKRNKAVAYRGVIWKNFLGAIIVLTFGASLGPEAALSAILGGLITWLGDHLKLTMKNKEDLLELSIGAMLAAIFHAPLVGVGELLEDSDRQTVFQNRLFKKSLYIMTAILGVVGFSLVQKQFPKETVFALHTPAIEWTTQVWWLILPAVIVGVIFGLIFNGLDDLSEAVAKRLKNPMLLALLAGLLIGVLGMISPYFLFSGEHQLLGFSKIALTKSAGALIVLALGKALLTNVCFAFGWRGGKIFPAIFASFAFGAALAVAFPYTPGLIVAVVVSASCAMIIEQPMVVAAVLLFLFPVQFFPAIIIVCWLVGNGQRVIKQRLMY